MALSSLCMVMALAFLKGFKGAELENIKDKIAGYLASTSGNGISDKIIEDDYIIRIDNCKPYIEYSNVYINHSKDTISFLGLTVTYVFDLEFIQELHHKIYSMSRKKITAVVKYDKVNFFVLLNEKVESYIFQEEITFDFNISTYFNYELYHGIIKSSTNENIAKKLSELFAVFLRKIQLNFVNEEEKRFNELVKRIEDAGLINVSEYSSGVEEVKFCCFDYIPDTYTFYNFRFILYYKTDEYSESIKVLINPVKFSKVFLSFGVISILDGKGLEPTVLRNVVTGVFERYRRFM